jgi:hypothetical protein
MRVESPKYINKNIADLPAVAGDYNVIIKNIRTLVPLYLKFNGKEWVNLERVSKMAGGDLSKISYYEQEVVKKFMALI